MFAILGPSLVYLPLLTTRIPVDYHSPREVAGYFQAFGMIRLGVESLTVLTPQESYSALHLHSFLSTPFVTIGYVEGGRLVSLAAAIAAAAAISAIASHLLDHRAAVIAPLAMWLNPMFARHAYLYMPETLSVAVTCGAILAGIYYVRTDYRVWLSAALFLLAIGVTNHMWEATIALPLAVLFLVHRKFRATALVCLTAPIAALIVYLVADLQPNGPSALTGYSTFANPGALLQSNFWFPGLVHPFSLSQSLVLVGGIVCFLSFGYVAVSAPDRRVPTVTAAWLLSGLCIPFLLAKGLIAHEYYLWGLWAPIALSVAYLFTQLLSALEIRMPDRRTRAAVNAVVVLLVVLAILNVAVFELGIAAGTGIPVLTGVDGAANGTPADLEPGATVEAGNAIREAGVTDASRIVFVGNWSRQSPPPYFGAPGSVLVYSGVFISGEAFAGGDPGPKFVQRSDQLPPCDVFLEKTGGSIRVSHCANTEVNATSS